VPDIRALVAAVESEATNMESELHGPHHWWCVAYIARLLAQQTSGCDPAVAFLFGLLHDSQRQHDFGDDAHGGRASALCARLAGRVFFPSSYQLETLSTACALHDAGLVSLDPTVGVCWDSDRLTLWRVGITPDPRWLSTSAGRGGVSLYLDLDMPSRLIDWIGLYAHIAAG
jgi:uncharacterized protein